MKSDWSLLVTDRAVRHRPVQIYQGGLGAARLRRIRELVDAKMENDLGLDCPARHETLLTPHRENRGAKPKRFGCTEID